LAANVATSKLGATPNFTPPSGFIDENCPPMRSKTLKNKNKWIKEAILE
jgi:hypothetical protein